MIQLEIANPYSKTEILSSIDDVSNKVSSFFSSISPELFFHNGLGGWSPAQNLSHLAYISSGAILLFKLPRFLFFIFGKKKTQRDFQTLLNDYIGSKKVIPLGPIAPAQILPKEGVKQISELIKKWEKTCEEIKEVIKNLPEKDFDEYSIPHPTMGMLSYREYLYLIIIHPIHHSYKVEQKLSYLNSN